MSITEEHSRARRTAPSNNALLLAALMSFITPVLGYEGMPASFKDYVPYTLGDGGDSGTVYLAPELSTTAKTKEGDGQDIYRSVRITTAKNNVIAIAFDPGPSEDPMFVVQVNGADERYIDGRVLYVSASESLYARTDSNDYFEKARKLRIVHNRIEEVAQPFYLVDRTCATSAALTLYTRQCNKGQPVATLPANSDVKIVLAEYQGTPCGQEIVAGNDRGDPLMSFLVATPFGLTGWVTSTAGYLDRPGRPLACITYHGD